MRLGIPTSVPLAVQQWDGLIAVNYEARKSGVKRGDRTATAKQKCPEITLVHVETIGADDEPDAAGIRHDKGACKVSLERYVGMPLHLSLNSVCVPLVLWLVEGGCRRECPVYFLNHNRDRAYPAGLHV